MKVMLGEGGPSSHGFHALQSIFYCKKEFQLKERRKITRPQEFTPDHFSVGSIFHAGRARWFSLRFRTDNKAWRKVKNAMDEEAAKFELPTTFKAQRLAQTYLAQYIEHWSMRPLPEPIAAEYLLGPVALKPSDPFYMFRTAKLDDVSVYPEAGGLLAIGESKTCSGSIYDTIKQYTLHGQPLLQYVLWKHAEQGEQAHGPVAGTILDVTRKGYGGKRCEFRRHFMPFEPSVLKWFAASIRGYLKDAERIQWDGYARRNIGNCTRIGGRGRVDCDYKDLCTFGRGVAGQYVFKDTQKILTTWKPKPGAMTPPWK